MTDDLFPDGDESDEDLAFDELRTALAGLLGDFVDQKGLDDGLLSGLLIDAAVAARTTDYAMSVEKPSETGLKMELDRFRRAFDDLIRMAKKNAGETVNHLRELIARAESEEPPAGKGEDS